MPPPRPQDFGPLYVETDMSRWPVEPWNTWSNLAFLAIVVFFLWKTKFNYRRHPLVVLSMPILFIGFVGGSIYHATRSNSLWLILDFVPIFILTAAAAYQFWKMLLRSTINAIVAPLLLILAARFLAFSLELSRGLTISLSYGALGVVILAPAFALSARRNWLGIFPLTNASLAFISAVIFRTLDTLMVRNQLPTLLPMGTHFLWHLLGALSVFFLMLFVLIHDTFNEKPS